ncbi:MAG: PEP-CTERM sorting domain-containing protein [Gammaproteobacteria bacterium]|nr:PEP-CTERM sorting domain-containing protein [Gammaproteobacteria bacterium]
MNIRTLSVVAIIMAAFLYATHAIAIPTYTLNSDGKITGLTGLQSGSNTYDLVLHDGSFTEYLAAEGEVDIYTHAFANQVTADLAAFLTMRGDILAPTSFFSCELDEGCHIASPWLVNDTSVGFASAFVDNISVKTINGSVPKANDVASVTWAAWSLADDVSVPEPSIMLLLCTGLLGIFVTTRRKA